MDESHQKCRSHAKGIYLEFHDRLAHRIMGMVRIDIVPEIVVLKPSTTAGVDERIVEKGKDPVFYEWSAQQDDDQT